MKKKKEEELQEVGAREGAKKLSEKNKIMKMKIIIDLPSSDE